MILAIAVYFFCKAPLHCGSGMVGYVMRAFSPGQVHS